ncbi:hypothetical protein ID866_11571 [Astraeus odoratus]|nr:hypothetical protein ID866_11571 [Astraeus odoratus]
MTTSSPLKGIQFSDHDVIRDIRDVDVAAKVNMKAVPLTDEEALRLRRKIDWHIMPLMCIMYLVTFMDKTTLGQAAVLGIIDDAHLTTNQYNWLGTIFYFSYLVFQYPQNLALQRFPVGKWMRFLETIKDPRIWLLAFIAGASNVVNSLTNQRQLIVSQFGFSAIQTTLLGCVDGVVEILTIWFGVALASRKYIGRAYAGVLMYIPAVAGTILVSVLPFSDKVGLLFSYWICSERLVFFPVGLLQ